jgi:hypothetical protein
VSSGCLLFGNTLADFVFTRRQDDRYDLALCAAALILCVTGLINMFHYMKPSRIFAPEHAKVWLRLTQAKLVLTLMLSPALDKLLAATGMTDKKLLAQFILIFLGTFLGSVAN